MNNGSSSGLGQNIPRGIPSDAKETPYQLASQIAGTPIADLELLGLDTLRQILEEIEIRKGTVRLFDSYKG